MPTVITNDQAVIWTPRQEWKWVVERPNIGSEVASKRHLGGAEHAAYGSPVGQSLNDAQLQDLPDYIPDSAPVIPPITVPPLTGHLSADIDTGTWHVTGSVG